MVIAPATAVRVCDWSLDRRQFGVASRSEIWRLSKEAHLIALRRSEQVGTQRHPLAGKARSSARFLETGADQVGPHTASAHSAAKVRVIVPAAPYVANDRHHLGGAIGIMFLQPGAE